MARTLIKGGTLTAAVKDATDNFTGDAVTRYDVSIVIGMTVRFDLASYSVGEAAGPLSFKMIARTGAGAPQPTADYDQGEVGTDATNGTATQGTDFDQFGASLNFPVGDFSANGGVWQAELTFSITINEDALDEDDETFDILLERGQSSASISVVDASGNSCGSVCTVTVTIDDDNTAGVTVSKSALTVTEQDLAGATYTVVLDSQPTANVTISIGGQAGTDVSAAPSPLIFTPINWDTAQTVTVTAANDAGTTNDVVSLTHSGVSSDTNYQGITIAGLEVNITDDDTANLVVSAFTLSVGEAGSGEFTVKLATQPSANVSVSVSSDDTAAATVVSRKPELHDGQLEHGADGDGQRGRRPGHRRGERDGVAERDGRRLRWQDSVGHGDHHGQRHGEPGGQRIHAERGGGGQRRLHGETGDAAQRRRKRVGVLGRHGSGDGVSRKPELHGGQLGHGADGDGQRGRTTRTPPRRA